MRRIEFEMGQGLMFAVKEGAERVFIEALLTHIKELIGVIKHTNNPLAIISSLESTSKMSIVISKLTIPQDPERLHEEVDKIVEAFKSDVEEGMLRNSEPRGSA